jgi:ABC-type glycerol-3-phosphate transport system substrate-binding protein
MNTSVVALRLKLVLPHINKMKCWWAFGIAFLAILIVFELAGFNDGKGLRASERWIPVPAPAEVAARVSDFQIKEWPRNLRTDLKGSLIKVVLPENAPDRPWNDALMAKFRELTGIEVQTIRPGNDTSAVLSTYLREFETGSPRADVYAIDIVWPGILSDYGEDLRPAFGDLGDMVPGLVENNTVHHQLIAVPYFVEISLLYYRRDLLGKYHFAQPPRTWNELERQAEAIARSERANGKNTFWGFLWQGPLLKH